MVLIGYLFPTAQKDCVRKYLLSILALGISCCQIKMLSVMFLHSKDGEKC